MDGGAAMHGAPSSRTRRRTGRRQTRGPVTADLRVEWVAAVIARVHHSRGWIGVCDERAVRFTDQGAAVVRGPAHASRRIRRRGSDILHHPLEGASP